MKKLYLFILFFVASTLLLLSQKNSPPQDTDSYFGEKSCWSYKAHISIFESWFEDISSTSHLQGDTLINEMNYRKFYDSYNYYSFPIVAVRQENQKIYAFDRSLQQEYLLYDFGVKEGDIIYSDAPSGYILHEPVVSKVDSVYLYNGERRKRIMIEGDEWIEGIGSVNGFDFPTRGFVNCECDSYYLIAFAKEDVISFFNPELASQWGYCGNVVDIAEVKMSLINVFYENNSIRIQGESSVFPCELKLFSPIGQLILQKRLQSGKEGVSINQLKGIYLYQVQKGREIVKTGKIMIK